MESIPLSEPFFQEAEARWVTECLRSGWVSSASPHVAQFESAVAAYTGAPWAVAVSSGTAALHLALIAAGVGPGDLVLTANLSFVAAANAIRYVQAEPVLIDAAEDSWQMEPALGLQFLAQDCVPAEAGLLHRASGRRIGAILLTHCLGYWADADAWLQIAERFALPLVEDAAEALGTWQGGRHAGSLGLLGCLSFNGNKILTTGGGGMLLTADPALAARVRHLSTQAKSQAGEYMHDETGFNYRMPGLAAALGLGQMEQLPFLLSRRREVFERYAGAFGAAAFAQVLEGSQPNYWLSTLRSPRRQAIQAALAAQQIQARPLWVPMNRLPMFANCLYINRNDISGLLYDSCLSLPSSASLSPEAQARVIACIAEAAGG